MLTGKFHNLYRNVTDNMYMTRDGRKNLNFQYNYLNLVGKVSGGGMTADYTWLADGKKLQVVDNSGDGYLYLGSLIYKRQNGVWALESTGFGGGRIIASEGGAGSGTVYTPYYHLTDHLGSVRSVFTYENGQPNVVAQNDYYAFGLKHENPLLAIGSDTENRFLYNSKELQTTGNLSLLDYGARMYNSELGRWFVIDPLVEQRYWLSPYNYVQNNPIRKVDSNGMLDDDYYYNESGKLIYYLKNQDPDRAFVIKTTQTTSEMYNDKTSDPSQRATVQSITPEIAAKTESEIAAGNLSGDHMQNVVQIQSTDKMQAMIKSIKDDGTKGTSDANNKEYSGSFTDKGVGNLKESNVGQPSKGQNLVTTGKNDFHSHPSGREKVNGGTASWQQPPSKQDINAAGNKLEYVPAMGNGTIYIYNNKGVIATIPISTFR